MGICVNEGKKRGGRKKAHTVSIVKSRERTLFVVMSLQCEKVYTWFLA